MELGVGTLPRGDDCLAKTHRILLRETFPLLFPAHSVYNPSIYFPLTRARGREKSETGRQERSNPPPQLISAILPIHRGATQHFVKNQSAAVSQRQMNESIHSINPSSQGCWQEMYDPLWMLVHTGCLWVSYISHEIDIWNKAATYMMFNWRSLGFGLFGGLKLAIEEVGVGCGTFIKRDCFLIIILK